MREIVELVRVCWPCVPPFVRKMQFVRSAKSNRNEAHNGSNGFKRGTVWEWAWSYRTVFLRKNRAELREMIANLLRLVRVNIIRAMGQGTSGLANFWSDQPAITRYSRSFIRQEVPEHGCCAYFARTSLCCLQKFSFFEWWFFFLHPSFFCNISILWSTGLRCPRAAALASDCAVFNSLH